MGCRHCTFGHENVASERKDGAKAPITINGGRRCILWSVLSRDDVSQLLLPAAAFCSDSERSFERLTEAVEQNLIQVASAHFAIIRDEAVDDVSSEPQLTCDFLRARGACSVSQFAFKAGQLVFVGAECFNSEAPGAVSVVISHSKILSRVVSNDNSHTHACTDLLRVLARFSSFSHVVLAEGCSVMFRVCLPPTIRGCSAKAVLAAVSTMCAGELSDVVAGHHSSWGLGRLQVFHALSDRKSERTVVAEFCMIAAPVAPASLTPLVRQLCPAAFKAMLEAGAAFQLVDVRNSWEFEIAHIPGARLLDANYLCQLLTLPRDTNLVFACHHGIRSQYAAQDFLDSHGFCKVFNLEGGIDAWSTMIDASVQRY
jgi:rhodanese-related sulfurtransferase